jgi:hypothetical protein
VSAPLLVLFTSCITGPSLWNYNPDNNDQRGDDWNGENFSWFSRKRGLPASLLYFDQSSPSLDNGARILPAVVRPYPAKTAGIPLRFEYEVTTGHFVYEWADPDALVADVEGPHSAEQLKRHPVLTSRETEVFVPSLLTHGRKLLVTGLSPEDHYVHDEARQTLFIVTRKSTKHAISVTLDPPLQPFFEVNSFWNDFGPRIFAFLVVLLGVIAHRIFA